MTTADADAPQSLPQYPELILAAIQSESDKNGADKSTISKHIEASYGDLPAAHSDLLSHHLNKMKETGELIMVKNNYLKPDADAPPRRGRGRPPKSKDPLKPDAVAPSSPRPRGRPPKPRDPLAPASPAEKTAPSESGRKRGRPPKIAKTTMEVEDEVEVPAAAAAAAAATPVVARRGRGRPPKAKMTTAQVGA